MEYNEQNQGYTNRELFMFLEDIKKDVTDIKTQTTKTNGRVSALENWRWFIMGGMVIVVTTGIPLLVYIYTNQIGN